MTERISVSLTMDLERLPLGENVSVDEIAQWIRDECHDHLIYCHKENDDALAHLYNVR